MLGKRSQTQTNTECFLSCAEPALHVYTHMYTHVTCEHEGDYLGGRRWLVGGDRRSEYGPINEVSHKMPLSNPPLHTINIY